MLRFVMSLMLVANCTAIHALDQAEVFAPGARWLKGDQVVMIGDGLWAANVRNWTGNIESFFDAAEAWRIDVRMVVAGANVRHYNHRLSQGTAGLDPNIAIVMLGHYEPFDGADDKEPIDQANYQSSVRAYVGMMVDMGAMVVLATPTLKSDKLDDKANTLLASYAEACRQIAASERDHVELCDLRAVFEKEVKAGNNIIDGAGNINNAGQRLISDEMLRAVTRAMKRKPVEVNIRDSLFIDDIELELAVRRMPEGDTAEIYYTTDGNPADEKAKKFKPGRPLKIKRETMLQVYAVTSGGERVRAKAMYREAKALKAERISKRKLGLNYAFYHHEGHSLPEFEKLTPSATGIYYAPDVDVRIFSPDTIAMTDNFAVRFWGYIEVPVEDVYTFYLRSNDGSKLWIGEGDDRQLVVNAAAGGGRQGGDGEIALEAGMHAIEIHYHEITGSEELQVSYSGRHFREIPLPETALFHEE